VKPLVLAGVRVWDGRSEGYARGIDALRIEGARIAALGRAGELSAGAQVQALAGLTLIPGLIDAHVHLDIDPALRAHEQQAAVPDAEAHAALRDRAAAMLRAGITTARDLGGPRWRELELRDAIAGGELTGPRLLCAGQPLTTPRGHCWYWGGEAADAAQIAAVVGRQVARRADWIKVVATGGRMTPGTQPHKPQFDAAQLGLAVREAQRAGRSVAAHCHGTPGIRNAAAAGVRSVEHCSFAGTAGFGADYDPALAEALARAGIWVAPTINAGWRRYFGAEGAPGAFARRMRAVYTGLRRSGVRLVASTDAGIPGVEHHRLPEALPLLAQLAGLRAVEALRAATSEAAAALGLERETGALAPGLAADLVAVEGDPLSDLGALLRPRLVVVGGRVALSCGERRPPARS
jgi:imidazolonepropionase-like amidohydrolase